MIRLTMFVVYSMIALNTFAFSQSRLNGFVLIEENSFQRGQGANQKGAMVRVEDFEILDHPVSNQEYKTFIDASGYRPPLHWIDGKIPTGKENHPVIYVNRRDVQTYLQWITEMDGRIYRLPTTAEFEYAARGGLKVQEYPWGNTAPEGLANYNAGGDRRFDRWQAYLAKAKSGAKNGFGLYGMAGNVWQMTINLHDPATIRWRYRIEDPALIESSVMAGSWARSAEYLRCGAQLGISAGIRHPDLGFRPVREPQTGNWDLENRKLCANSIGAGKVFLSWALLDQDSPSTAFDIYRATERNHAGFRVNENKIRNATCFIDTGLLVGKRYQYYVKPVSANGSKAKRSEWIGVDVTEEMVSAAFQFRPLYQQGTLVPVFGDLTGDGTFDCVIRMDNGNREMSQDPGLPVQLEAFTSYGRSLWRKDVCGHDFCYGSANNVPFNVWDMDKNGKAEVITRLQIADSVFVAILDGLSGAVRYKVPWPEMVSDFYRSSTRIHLSVACLDGSNPAVITQTGLYENEVFVAYDARLKKLWQFNSFAETSGSGGHKIEIADVDGDGRHEIFNGTTCLNSDGTLRWSLYRQHPDIVSIHDYLPDRPGLEVFYIVESSVHAGVYMVAADNGEVIWKVNREDDARWKHGHRGWTADIWQASPGIECVSNRAGHDDHNLILFAADGQVLLEPFPSGLVPLEWDGDPTRELLATDDFSIGNFDGETIIPVTDAQFNLPRDSGLLMVADLYGDFRDELVLQSTDTQNRRFISVVTACSPSTDRYITATASLDYRFWLARNMGGGYRSIYDRVLSKAKVPSDGASF